MRNGALPATWEIFRSPDDGRCTGTYRHSHLALEMLITRVEDESDQEFEITLRWDSGSGRVDGEFELDEPLTADEDAKNWALALMTQIDLKFTPGQTNYVTRAMQATRGESVDLPDVASSTNNECPVCDAPLFQFRGMDSHEQTSNHVEYVDDEAHADSDISLEK